MILLKRYVTLIFIITCLYSFSFSEVNVSGTIDKIENWTTQNSPYIINDELTIKEKGFITIYPGTEVKFEKKGRIIVQGRLYAKGTIQAPVRFVSSDGESFYDGIRYESKYKNVMEYAIMIRGAIVTEGTSLTMNNCYILNSTGVEILDFSNVILKNNYFYENTYGLYIEGQKISCTANGNTFNKCRYGLYLKDPYKGEIKGNNFFDSSYVNVINYTSYPINCKNNYWGFKTEKDISKTIADKTKDKNFGLIVFKPFEKKQLALFMPPPSFASLVRIYLNVPKREEEIRHIGLSAGMSFFMPITPESLQKESYYGLGFDAEFVSTIAGPFMLGIEAKSLGLDNQNKSLYNYQYSATNLFFNLYGYMGYKKDVFLLPYVKFGNGLSIISEQYKYFLTGETKKNNNMYYIVYGGVGMEFFAEKFLSISLNAGYNYSPANNGGLSNITTDLLAKIYFSTPFFLNE